ncbi:hypothetical protein COLO4_25344 [Corchorus olitorius]|uniref:Uncharacterized protein n=1 Tax=Corchorus olitorius TaxID=93759 RepID=A0A1R3I3H4_9ROSI|nr:hypothetical protein COLO4_25344 [Corchorus olitorius]
MNNKGKGRLETQKKSKSFCLGDEERKGMSWWQSECTTFDLLGTLPTLNHPFIDTY